MDIVELHTHLWYLEESKYLIDKIPKGMFDRINISLVKDSPANDEILDYARSKFSTVKFVTVENMGNDQNGFIESIRSNSEGKEWILYAHDKKNNIWVDDLLDPIFARLDNFQVRPNIGLIGAHKRVMRNENEEYLAKRDKELPFESKLDIVRYKHTIVWLRELQYVAFQEYNFFQKENIDFEFISGTMFLARRPVVELTHACVHDSYFTPGYLPNGNVEHGIERFYGYINLCLQLEMEKLL